MVETNALFPLLGSPSPEQLRQQLSAMSTSQLQQLLQLARQFFRKESRNRFLTYFSTPLVRSQYAKQMQFFGLGKKFQERALFGGNRSGKTIAGTFEDTLHLTGLYPDWWDDIGGYRFDRPIDAWAAGDTGKTTRDILQATLLGKPGDDSAFGTGMIPGDLIIRTTVKHGLADAVESVFVRHVSGGVSSLQLKSYDQGRDAFQGTAEDLIHLDEECDLEIYVECLLRLMTTDGRLILTATPLLGLTELMLQFLPELAPAPDEPGRSGWQKSEGDE